MEANIDKIKNHIINNFLIPYYKYSCVMLINTVIADIKMRSWFPCEYNYDKNCLDINIDENNVISIKFIWESYQSQNRFMNVLKGFE